MKSRSKELRTAVKEHLIPFILSRNFERDSRPIHKNDPYAHMAMNFLRRTGDTLQLLQIQFDKYGSGSFVLNFGNVPKEGVTQFGLHIPEGQAAIGDLDSWARLYASRAWRLRFFGFPWIKIPYFRNPSAKQVVDKVIKLFPQIEIWLQDGIRGPNIGVHPTPSLLFHFGLEKYKVTQNKRK